MSEEMQEEQELVVTPPLRQWVTQPQGSLDLRVGRQTLDTIGHELTVSVGRPNRALLVYSDTLPTDYLELIHRELIGAGFQLVEKSVHETAELRSFEKLPHYVAMLKEAEITGDDLVVVAGGADLASVFSYICSSWCGKTNLAYVPTNIYAALISGITPLGLTLEADETSPLARTSINVSACINFEFVDLRLLHLDEDSAEKRLALALMAQTALADDESHVERLFDRAEELVQGVAGAWILQLAEAVKGRGRIASSNSMALRASINYGMLVAWALEQETESEAAASLVSALKFLSRLAVAHDDFSLDDMFTQDELLERMGLVDAHGSIDPEALYQKMRALAFRYSQRFMLELPHAFGRVRATNIDEALMMEHLSAFCQNLA